MGREGNLPLKGLRLKGGWGGSGNGWGRERSGWEEKGWEEKGWRGKGGGWRERW